MLTEARALAHSVGDMYLVAHAEACSAGSKTSLET